jgi:hypothetical protein
MIGSPASAVGRAAGIGAALLLGLLLAMRPADPAVADPALAAHRLRVLQELATTDDLRLAALTAELQRAVDAGRRGSALIIEGKTPPTGDLQAAADAAARAAGLAMASEQADRAVDGTMLSVAPGGLTVLPAGPRSGELIGIDGQLREAADASAPFVKRRKAAAATLDALGAALASLDADDPDAALRALDRAHSARATVAAWPSPPLVLPYWLRTTGGMLFAARRIAHATLAGDAAAAERAGRAYQRAARNARRADTALALAISESGASLASVPLQRLADALESATDRRAAMASVVLGTR